MSENSSIEWTDATWNPVTGCTEVSPGCAHCYAKVFAERWRGKKDHPYEMGFDLTLRPERLDQPRRWRKPRMIFVNSMSDLFHEDVPTDFIAQVYQAMVDTPRHIFQVLTKRASAMADLTDPGEPVEVTSWEFGTTELLRNAEHGELSPFLTDEDGTMLEEASHIWHGVSVENVSGPLPVLRAAPGSAGYHALPSAPPVGDCRR